MRLIRVTFATALAMSASAGAAQLPNGVSSLSETYGDWVVACQMQGDAPRCQMTQAQTDTKTRQLLLAMEVRPVDDRTMAATFLMPFGLVLKKGVTLQLDESHNMPTVDFSTCLPTGCLAPAVFGQPLLDAIRTAKTLYISGAVAADNKTFSAKVSLNGFAAGWERLVALSK